MNKPYLVTYSFYDGRGNRLSVFGEVFDNELWIVVFTCRDKQFKKGIVKEAYEKWRTGSRGYWDGRTTIVISEIKTERKKAKGTEKGYIEIPVRIGTTFNPFIHRLPLISGNVLNTYRNAFFDYCRRNYYKIDYQYFKYIGYFLEISDNTSWNKQLVIKTLVHDTGKDKRVSGTGA